MIDTAFAEHITHECQATLEDSIVRLSLHKSDSIARVSGV